ncbi:YjjG family noncanonical pyrimidine nucleotidase [Christiangramia portivictoriae]|uniref:YjjG family noncanonical pyrimidine nucleotidase n=1 Tax=Christiangramia portivictoriae TaxID=326069 RepID=UPI00047DDAA3|nr:YjjG family noncanonical pyrimidine nucleotidase [Christiangramia portivictoriae]
MKLTNIRDVYFDLDHTLWDFDRNSSMAFQQIFIDQKLDIKLQDFLQIYMPINHQYWESYRNDLVSKEDLRYGRLKDSFTALELEVDDSMIFKMSEDYINYLPNHNYLLDGAIDILSYLSTSYNLHIITNGFEEVQHLKMEKSGILKYFKTITTSEDAGVKKPHSRIFEKAISKGTGKAETSVMIGDNFSADICGGFQYGMKVIYIDSRQENSRTEHPRIEKLKQLRDYL